MWSAYDTITDISIAGIYIGDPAEPIFFFSVHRQTAIYKLRVATKQTTTRNFGLLVVFINITVEFYTDTNFRSNLINKSSYPVHQIIYSFKAYSPGTKVVNSNHIYVNFTLNNVKLTLPTCFTSILTGPLQSMVQRLKMGEYSLGQIKTVHTVPFDISLQNCIRVRNIETKLSQQR